MLDTKLPLYIAAILSVLIGLGSLRFLGLGLDLAFPDMLGHLLNRRTAFIFHVTAAPVALIIGAIQLFPKMRAAHKTRHRWLGRIYGVSVLLAGVSGLIIALNAAGGVSVAFGLGILSILWIATTTIAIIYAMKRNIALHRRWMIRSFALTFAAVTLRLYLLGFMAGGFTYTEASVYVAWLCWVPNMIFAEWWLRRKKP